MTKPPETETVQMLFAMHYHGQGNGYDAALEAFDAWLEEVRRKASEMAWHQAREAIRGIPHWYSTETGTGGFDLQPLGPNHSSEEGAFMAVREALRDNPYRKEY